MGMHGWMGKILRVNLTNSKIDQLSTQPYAEQCLGGRGIGAQIYWETVAPEIRAFDPENRLIFMTGPLVATGTSGATQLSVVGKSPMTLPEGYCYGSLGGFVGAELKKAGFDGIIVEGRASKPVYLWIHDGEAELKDASSVWGQNGYRSGEMLQQTHGEKTRFITIGVAGERKVRTAVALASHNCTLSAGFGAVMGSKNLKAMAIRGSGKISVADPEKLKGLYRYTIHISKRIRLSIPPRVAATGHAHLLETIGKGSCYQCGFECIRGLYRYGKREELTENLKCQSMQCYLPWVYSRDDEPVETFFKAPIMVNDYTLESWEIESMVDWLYACYQAGALTAQETGLPLSKIGTREFLEKLLHAIAYREGFGDVLAEGLVRIGDKVSDNARALFSHHVAPMGMHDLFPPRLFPIMALLYPPEPRIHHMNLHEIAFVFAPWSFNKFEPGSTPVTTKLIHDIARAFWGSDEAGNFSSYEGKARAAKLIQNRVYTKEILGLCDFGWPILYSFNTPDHVGDPDLIAKIFTAVTGIAGEELDRYAERHYNLQRLILLREGRKVPEADYPLEFNFTEPMEDIIHFGLLEVPGPGEEAVSMQGKTLDRDKFSAMLKEYYRLRGWDEETGVPRAETLAALGLDG
jgi:aldehyde:ferredoxin oxidoreductase